MVSPTFPVPLFSSRQINTISVPIDKRLLTHLLPNNEVIKQRQLLQLQTASEFNPSALWKTLPRNNKHLGLVIEFKSPYLKLYESLVLQKYTEETQRFLEMEIPGIRNTGKILEEFMDFIQLVSTREMSPIELINKFFEENQSVNEFFASEGYQGLEINQKKQALLYNFSQYLRRIIGVFNAAENGAFEKITDLRGIGSFDYLATELKDILAKQLMTKDEVRDSIKDLAYELVFTAHPTEPQTPEFSAVEIGLSNLFREENETHYVSEQDKDHWLRSFAQTKARHHENAPSPLDELKGQAVFMENIYYCFPRIYTQIERLCKEVFGSEYKNYYEEIIKDFSVKLSTWAAVDRDGNKAVTAELTRQGASYLRAEILKLYRTDLQSIKKNFPNQGDQIQTVIEKLRQTDLGPNLEIKSEYLGYKTADEFVQDLIKIQTNANASPSTYSDELDHIVLNAQIFGLQLASFQYRQSRFKHSEAVLELLKELDSYGENKASLYQRMSDFEKINLIDIILESNQNTSNVTEALANRDYTDELWGERTDEESQTLQETFKSLIAFKDIQDINGVDSISQYNISQTNSAVNVKELMLLMHFAGTKNFDPVPLFESVNDLRNSVSIMETLFENGHYRQHLQERNNIQTILLGFSDSMVDSGYLSAGEEIHKAKKELTKLGKKNGIEIKFFEGRGGSPARGGSPTNLGIRANDPDISMKKYSVTAQGEIPRTQYGTQPLTLWNITNVITGMMRHAVSSKLVDKYNAQQISELPSFERGLVDNAERAQSILTELSNISRTLYRQRIWGDDEQGNEGDGSTTYEFLRSVTPFDFFPQAKMASRQSKSSERSKASSKALKEVRAIPFCNSGAMQGANYASFLPFGSTIQKYLSLHPESGMDELKWLYKSDLRFQTSIEGMSQGLLKSNMRITKDLVDGNDFLRELHNEYKITCDLIRQIQDGKDLLWSNQTLRRSIEERNKLAEVAMLILRYAKDNLLESDTPNLHRAAKEFTDEEGNTPLVVSSMLGVLDALRNSS